MIVCPVVMELFFCDVFAAIGQDSKAEETFFGWSGHNPGLFCQALQILMRPERWLFQQKSN
jgi:hypothetical protein